MTVGDHLLHPNYMRLFPRGEITVLSVADSKHYTASTSCFGIDEDLRIRLWNDYRKLAQKQTELYQKGKCSKEELQARYYIYIMSRDIQTVDCDCPLESPSYVDRQQVFAKDLDPICMLALSNAYVAMCADTTFKDKGRKENVLELLAWYASRSGFGELYSYDAYANFIPFDTSVFNGHIRKLSYDFNVRNAKPVKVEIIKK